MRQRGQAVPERGLADILWHGYWLCHGCVNVTETEDDERGWRRCVQCHSVKVEWFDGIERCSTWNALSHVEQFSNAKG